MVLFNNPSSRRGQQQKWSQLETVLLWPGITILKVTCAKLGDQTLTSLTRIMDPVASGKYFSNHFQKAEFKSNTWSFNRRRKKLNYYQYNENNSF